MSTSICFPRLGGAHPLFLSACTPFHNHGLEIHQLEAEWAWAFDHFETMNEINDLFPLVFAKEEKVDISFPTRASFYNMAFTKLELPLELINARRASMMYSLMDPDMDKTLIPVRNHFLNVMIRAQQEYILSTPALCV